MSRLGLTRTRVVRGLSVAALGLVALAPAASSSGVGAGAADRWNAAPSPTAVVGYRSRADLARVLRRHPGLVLRSIPALGVAEILPRAKPQFFATATADLQGIDYVEPPVVRMDDSDPALEPSSASLPGGVLEWQYAAARVDRVPDSVLRAAAAITIAVVDTGADITAPDIAAKSPVTHSVVTRGQVVRDTVGHGTFVAALAAGSITNGDGIAGFGGDARLAIVQASASQGAFSDFDEAAGIVWAVDHGARILNLSLGGPDTSTTERKAIDYAVSHGALLVAAVGNEHDQSNPVEYPAALVQPVGSNGRGGAGLAVGASDSDGNRAPFSNTGSHLSLVAPGVNVLSALSTAGANIGYVKVPVPGARSGIYAFGSGTSFAAPEVSGAAALVWAANPSLSAQQVAQIIKETASNRGSWNDELGYGVIDVAAAVGRASGRAETGAAVTLRGAADGGRIRLTWAGQGAKAYSLSVRDGAGPARVVLPSTRQTSAVFAGRAGHSYAFVVQALDGGGATTAASNALMVSVPAAQADLTLTASAAAGRAPLGVVLRASLAPVGASAPMGGRRIVIEAFDGGGWQAEDDAITSGTGRAAWRFTLDPGVYRVRARFTGARDLGAAVSRTVSVRVT